MTDKEIIREKIEKLCEIVYLPCNKKRHGFKMGFMNAIDEVIKIFDSMQEEPISNPTPNEKMSVERWKRACEAACCDRNYRSHYGLTETRDDYFVDGVQWADEHPKEEPVSEDLEKEIQQYIQQKKLSDVSFIVPSIARHFANWQKLQMMKDAISGKVTVIYYPTDSCLEIEATLPEDRFEDGDKVLIIKED